MTAIANIVMRRLMFPAGLFFFALAWSAAAQAIKVTQRLAGFDEYMAKTLKDWNAPGVGVGIVVNHERSSPKATAFGTMRRNCRIPPPR